MKPWPAQRNSKREGVVASLSVTPCWCYGSETMDMDPQIPKAVWGFNGTERPGAVYLAAVLAAHAQKKVCPHSAFTGGTSRTPAIPTFPKTCGRKYCGLHVRRRRWGEMRCKSYLSCGSVSMGIAGSIVNPDFFESYLGMRCEQVDMSEYIRRVEEEIYDKDEYKKGVCVGEGALPGRRGQECAALVQAAQGLGMGVHGEMRARREGPDGREPKTDRDGI